MILHPVIGRVNALYLRADNLILFCIRPVDTTDTICLTCFTYTLPLFYPFCFALKPLANVNHFLICAFLFTFNALWLAVFRHANHLFLMGL